MEKMLKQINSDVSNAENLCEYDLLIQLEKILMLNGFPVLLGELNVLSGYAFRFLYSYDDPFIFNDSIPFIRENLSNFTNLEISFEDISTDSFSAKKLPFILYPENILVYCIKDSLVNYYRMFQEESIDIEEAVKRNAKIISIGSFYKLSRVDIFKDSIFRDLSSLMASEFKNNGVSSYEDFALDLRNAKKSFSGLSHLWFNRAAYSQWTALFGLNSYILGQFHFLDYSRQEMLKEILKSFEDAILYWKEWGRAVGKEAGISSYEQITMELRLRAANAVDRARKSMESIIKKLENIL
jgi:hypothetical protein